VEDEAIMKLVRNFDEKRGPQDYGRKEVSFRGMIFFFIGFLG
jgi:hypothetical protein